MKFSYIFNHERRHKSVIGRQFTKKNCSAGNESLESAERAASQHDNLSRILPK